MLRSIYSKDAEREGHAISGRERKPPYRDPELSSRRSTQLYLYAQGLVPCEAPVVTPLGTMPIHETQPCPPEIASTGQRRAADSRLVHWL